MIISKPDIDALRQRVLDLSLDVRVVYTRGDVSALLSDLEWCLDEIERLQGRSDRRAKIARCRAARAEGQGVEHVAG